MNEHEAELKHLQELIESARPDKRKSMMACVRVLIKKLEAKQKQSDREYISPQEYKIALSNGISNKRLYARVNEYGWDKQRAMTEAVHEQHAPRSKWQDVAEKNGIKYDTFYRRVKVLGWEPERAATIPTQDPLGNLEARRSRFSEEIHKLREANGIPMATFYNRIKLKWDAHRAATEPVWTREQIGKNGRAKSPKFSFRY